LNPDGFVVVFFLISTVSDPVVAGVDVSDFPKAIELVKEQVAKVEIYSAAAKDVSLVKAELQDVDKEELITLVMKLASAVSEIEKA